MRPKPHHRCEGLRFNSSHRSRYEIRQMGGESLAQCVRFGCECVEVCTCAMETVKSVRNEASNAGSANCVMSSPAKRTSKSTLSSSRGSGGGGGDGDDGGDDDEDGSDGGDDGLFNTNANTIVSNIASASAAR